MIQRKLLSHFSKVLVEEEQKTWEFDTIESASTGAVPISINTVYEGMIIDWGDGNVTEVTSDMSVSEAYVHSYATSGQYHITATYDDWSNVELFYGSASASSPITEARSCIKKIYRLPKVANISFANMFYMYLGLTDIATDLFANNLQIESFSNTFRLCIYLTSVSEELFANHKAVTSFDYTLLGCQGLSNQVLRIGSEIVTNAEYFMFNTGNDNIVYLVAGSTTHETFQNATNIGCAIVFE